MAIHVSGKEAIAMLECSRTSFYRWTASRQIEPRLIAKSKNPVYLKSEIEAFKRNHADVAKRANKYAIHMGGNATEGEKRTSLEKVKDAEARILQECAHIFEKYPLDPIKGDDYNQAQMRKQMLAMAEHQRLIVRFFALLDSDSEQNRLKTMEGLVKYLVPLISQQKVTHSPSSQWTDLVQKMEAIRQEIREAADPKRNKEAADFSPEFLEILQVTELQEIK